jgi:hypothetical protein
MDNYEPKIGHDREFVFYQLTAGKAELIVSFANKTNLEYQ